MAKEELVLAAPAHIQPSDPTLLARDAVGKEFLTEVGKTDVRVTYGGTADEHSRGPAVQVKERKALEENEQMEAEEQPAARDSLIANSMKRLDDKFEGCGSTGELYAAHAGANALHPTTRRATSPTGNAHGKRVRFAPLFPGKWVGITCERWAPEPDLYNWGEITNSFVCRVINHSPQGFTHVL